MEHRGHQDRHLQDSRAEESCRAYGSHADLAKRVHLIPHLSADEEGSAGLVNVLQQLSQQQSVKMKLANTSRSLQAPSQEVLPQEWRHKQRSHARMLPRTLETQDARS